MVSKREMTRHLKVINQIKNANVLADLPKIGYGDIASLLANHEYFGEKLDLMCFKQVAESIKKYGLTSYRVIYTLTKVLVENCSCYIGKHCDFDAEEIKVSIIYKDIINEGKIGNLYSEIILMQDKKKELLKEEENERHNSILEQINDATSIIELPKISYSNIASYLASKEHFGKRINQSQFKSYVTELINYGNPMDERVVKSFKDIIYTYSCFNITNDDIDKKIIEIYKDIINEGKIGHIIHEINLRDRKIYSLEKEENEKSHKLTMSLINNAYEEKYLPKIGIGELNKRVLRAVNSNSYKKDFKTGDIAEISNCFLSNDLSNLRDYVNKLVFNTCVLEKEEMFYEIIGSLLNDYTINYVAEEIIAIEQRRRKIYESDHNDLMDSLKEATRMYQLPSMSFSTLTSYLCGNSTIYTNDNSFKSEHFKKLTEILLDGKKWEDKEIRDELYRICSLVYPSKVDAFDLLFKKLTSLPKTYYLVDEINLIKNLQKEFIENGQSNVNVYFIPNPKAPSEGGKFYNVYINRVGKINLDEVLPLDLNSIVAPGTDIDAVEWLVGKVDKTFKKVGGIILYRDESIGEITVYKVSDGKVGISKEEKVEYETMKGQLDQIDTLDLEIKTREDRIKELDDIIKAKEERISLLDQEYEVKSKDMLSIYRSVNDIVTSSKSKLSILQKEINDSISCIDDLASGFVKKREDIKE